MKACELVQMADEITRLGYDSIRDRAVEIFKEYTQLNKTRFVIWDPAHGEFVMEVHLPVPIKDLQSLPTAKIQQYWNRLQHAVDAMTPAMDWNMMDTYYEYKPSSDITNWVPPFKGRLIYHLWENIMRNALMINSNIIIKVRKLFQYHHMHFNISFLAHASIVGNQHYMTFDKKFYEFAGDCSYLLARDFVDGSFSVIVNYENGAKKSISAIIGNSNVEIFSNYKVNLNKAQTELPISTPHLIATREGSIIKVSLRKRTLYIQKKLP